MNRTIKDATVKRFFYDNNDQLLGRRRDWLFLIFGLVLVGRADHINPVVHLSGGRIEVVLDRGSR